MIIELSDDAMMVHQRDEKLNDMQTVGLHHTKSHVMLYQDDDMIILTAPGAIEIGKLLVKLGRAMKEG